MPVYHTKSPETEAGAFLFRVGCSQETLQENIGMHCQKEGNEVGIRITSIWVTSSFNLFMPSCHFVGPSLLESKFTYTTFTY